MYIYVLLFGMCVYVCSEEVYSPEELLAMIFNSSRQVAEDYAGTIFVISVLSRICMYIHNVLMHKILYAALSVNGLHMYLQYITMFCSVNAIIV